ncbi:hypothetical protein C0Z01_19400 [Photobacterium kishitanii]|uniref:EAL domain-containing protein n=1 Tax=Photobacterium kishitanii TaxID=318456 RepID=UPI000D16B559|nr:EAL domain-containing protein [Photobacterium kishitanii]PSW67632.1 hypothetical protein C0Z01_19400 [Photobacterium kishitanii]
MKKLFPFCVIIFLSIFLSLLISNITIRYIEKNQISNILSLLDNVIYKPQLHIEHESNIDGSNKENNERFLENIEIKYPEIMNISYIDNGKYYYNNSGINKPVPKYIRNIISDNIRVKLFNDPYDKNKINYIFKFGSGYYLIDFYSELLKTLSHNAITNFEIIDSNEKPKSNLYYSLSHNAKHLHVIIISGLTLNKLLLIMALSFSLSLISLKIVELNLTSFFESKKVLHRKLKKAANNHEFVPYFQSVYSTKQQKFIAAEVLCRWIYDGKIIPPSEFITDLEKTPDINIVTFNLIKDAFATIRKSSVNKDFMLSFNFTVTMLLDEKFMNKIIHFIRKNPAIKNKFIIELTESENNFIYLNEINKVMQKLKQESILLSIDDVGTGYSNLLTIQELPFDIMKIDRCFISDRFAVSKSNMLETLATLGNALNLTIVAEGIETESEVKKVNSFNIDLCQGFYYSTPCDAKTFIARIESEPHLYQ